MVTYLKEWKGTIEINGENVDISCFKPFSDDIHIKLYPKAKKCVNNSGRRVETGIKLFKIQVRKYMTQKSNANFDFMAKWNNDIPMPLRIMVGEKVKETPGMVYMKLHADITEQQTFVCMKCGKPLTNPVSQYFGIGPECGGHNYTHPFATDDELKQAVAEYRKKLQGITWEGWVIKSAIEKEEIVYVDTSTKETD